MVNYTKKAVRGTVLVFLMMLVAAILSYVFRLILTRKLTTTEYGLFYAIFAFASLFMIFRDFGLVTALSKFIPEFLVKNDKESIKSVIILALIVQLVCLGVISIVLFIISDYLAINYFHNQIASLVLKIMIVAFLISSFEQVLIFTFAGFQNMKYYSLVNPIRVFLILITSLILFHFDFRVMAPTYAHLIAYIITPFILFPLLLKVFPDFFKIKFSLKKELVKKLFKFGIPIMITMLGGLIISYTDTLIITYFRTLEEVALYNVAVPTTKLLWYFSQAIATVIFPMTSELWARGLRGGLAKGLELLLKYSFVLVVPFALILFSFPKIILRILFGESYIGASSALQILAIGAIFYTLYYINNAVISGIGKPQINTKIILVVALFNLVFNIIMVPTYGIVGAAITTSLSFLIALLWNSIVLKRLIKIKVPIVYWLKTLLCGGALLVVIFWLKDLLNLGIWPELIICALLGIGAYIALIYILKLISINEIKGIIRNFL